MAAIFERQIVLQTDTTQQLSISLDRKGVRQAPFEFTKSLASRPFYLDETLLDVTQADWLYTALDEITLKNPPPIWTKDEWAFPPISFSSPNVTRSGKVQYGLDVLSPFANITMNTYALRSRLECTSITVPVSGWLDRAEDVFPDQIHEPITGYVLPVTLFKEEPYKTPVFSAPRRMACCTNNTAPDGQSLIAYWSSSSPMVEERAAESVDKNGPNNFKESDAWSTNFTIKWILGETKSTVISGTDSNKSHGYPTFVGTANETLLYYTKEPQISAMNCMPVIEQANASITVARYTGQVLEVRLLEEPQPVDGAWTQAWDIVYDKPSSNHSQGNVRYVYDTVRIYGLLVS
jgi:hypothetical protein